VNFLNFRDVVPKPGAAQPDHGSGMNCPEKPHVRSRAPLVKALGIGMTSSRVSLRCTSVLSRDAQAKTLALFQAEERNVAQRRVESATGTDLGQHSHLMLS
jgi:hypothetical protein